jgi:hypothetical protein
MHLATKGLFFVGVYNVNAFQHTNLALEGAPSTLEFNQDGEDLAKKLEHVLKMTELLVEKTQNPTNNLLMPDDAK